MPVDPPPSLSTPASSSAEARAFPRFPGLARASAHSLASFVPMYSYVALIAEDPASWSKAEILWPPPGQSTYGTYRRGCVGSVVLHWGAFTRSPA